MHKTVLSIIGTAALSLGLVAGCGPSPRFTSARADGGSAGAAGASGSAGSADGGSAGSADIDAGSTGGSAGSATNADGGSAGNTTDAGTAGCNTADAGTAPGCTNDGDCPNGQLCDTTGTCVPAPAPAPLSATAACDGNGCTCTLHFGAAYISNATCGEARGGMPGMSWSSGPSITDQNGDPADLELTVDGDAAVPGTYDLSYVGLGSCGASQSEEWAQYGDADQLAAMDPADRDFVSCNWWDASSGTAVSVSDPSCDLKVQVSVTTASDGTKHCTFAPAGNMHDYHK